MSSFSNFLTLLTTNLHHFCILYMKEKTASYKLDDIVLLKNCAQLIALNF